MSSAMIFLSRRQWLWAILALFLGLSLAFFLWVLKLNRQMAERLEKGWFLPPIEFYSSPKRVSLGSVWEPEAFLRQLASQGWREKAIGQDLVVKDFTRHHPEECRPASEFAFDQETIDRGPCIEFHHATFGRVRIGWDLQDKVRYIAPESLKFLEFEAELFAQYHDNQPILRRITEIGHTPLYCLQAVTAIEDADFLEHPGVSFTAIGRALIRNLQKARFAEGGSTITQQLVKNYFLTSEKRLTRKLKEQLMAILLESHYSKDDIIKNYLNVIYMGQNGPFQVRGFGAAARFYFQKELETLRLEECAMLAAIINNPGRYHPQRHPDLARARRRLVLERMQALNMISIEDLSTAGLAPLPRGQSQLMSEPAPYFVQATLKHLETLGLDSEQGLKIYTTLQPELQELAQSLLLKSTAIIESRLPKQKSKAARTESLQSSLLVVDLKTGGVASLVGGRQYKQTQYNRVISSRRQPGSLFKPVVYLAALETARSGGPNYNPLTLLQDGPWSHTYEGQTWTPQNYDRQFRGPVPLFYALTNSLNVPTARLATEVGLENIIELSRRLGISSPLLALPSLALGAFEVSPWEIAQAYSTIARFGEYIPLSLIQKIESAQGEILHQAQHKPKPVLLREPTAVLVSMLEKTFSIGTAQAARSRGWQGVAAGKTGTTSDGRDAWFAGFTPDLLVITWLGYDDNTPTGLTGASGALPIWTDYMIKAQKFFPQRAFDWPPTTLKKTLDSKTLERFWPRQDAQNRPSELELLFDVQNSPFE